MTSQRSQALCSASLHSWKVGCVIRRFHSVNGCRGTQGQTAKQSIHFDIKTCVNVGQTEADWKEANTMELDSGDFSLIQT